MEENLQESQSLSKKERRELRRQEKLDRKDEIGRKKKFKRIWWIVVIILFVLAFLGLILYSFMAGDASPDVPGLISRKGIHWHTNLSIKIQGVEQEIPKDIGIKGLIHNPVHTHDLDGVIHLEFSGRVTQSDIRLSEFFKAWGKTFSKDCIFEFCTGLVGTVTMQVNGEQDTLFENYLMQDGDRVEIRYDTILEG